MTAIRELYPEMVSQLDEADARRMQRALDSFQQAYRELHEAGPGVMGEDHYEDFLSNRIESHMTRGET